MRALATATAIAAHDSLSCMEHGSDVISLLERTKMLMDQYYWIPSELDGTVLLALS